MASSEELEVLAQGLLHRVVRRVRERLQRRPARAEVEARLHLDGRTENSRRSAVAALLQQPGQPVDVLLLGQRTLQVARVEGVEDLVVRAHGERVVERDGHRGLRAHGEGGHHLLGEAGHDVVLAALHLREVCVLGQVRRRVLDAVHRRDLRARRLQELPHRDRGRDVRHDGDVVVVEGGLRRGRGQVLHPVHHLRHVRRLEEGGRHGGDGVDTDALRLLGEDLRLLQRRGADVQDELRAGLRAVELRLVRLRDGNALLDGLAGALAGGAAQEDGARLHALDELNLLGDDGEVDLAVLVVRRERGDNQALKLAQGGEADGGRAQHCVWCGVESEGGAQRGKFNEVQIL
eukprot:Rhum_TRINITY_DN2034_c0_g1::Rhum_TRINITY_DN2034_c0_g1_i1::g.5539::m.5539